MTRDVRDHLALRLEGGDADSAIELARRLTPWFGVAKIGIDLLIVGGAELAARLEVEGMAVFCDFKLHDIPDQVEASARAAGRLAPRYLTLHAAGGFEMLAAGVAGLAAGAAEGGGEPPIALGVTVLTSDPDAAAFDGRLATAAAAGCGGVVCSAHEARRVKAAHPDLEVVTPGIRLVEANDDQARVATPGHAIRNGSDLLVVGRPVVAAADPESVAAQISASVKDALEM